MSVKNTTICQDFLSKINADGIKMARKGNTMVFMHASHGGAGPDRELSGNATAMLAREFLLSRDKTADCRQRYLNFFLNDVIEYSLSIAPDVCPSDSGVTPNP